jgi:Flp pilus assembly protein TadG
MGTPFSLFWSHRAGTAGAEMALVLPLLLVLLFGTFELGNYFYSEHVVVKAVRDGARYAARQSFGHYSCPGATIIDNNGVTAAQLIQDVQDVTRTGKVSPANSDVPRLGYWTSTYDSANTAITVTVRCTSATSYSGIYRGIVGGIPSVLVTAHVKYLSLFQFIGLGRSSYYLNAESEAAVMGI